MTLLLVLVLVTWRLSSLIVYEDGPLDVFARVRRAAGVDQPGELTNLAKGLSCLWCVSVWVGAVVALAFIQYWDGTVFRLLLPFALSGGAIAVDRIVRLQS